MKAKDIPCKECGGKPKIHGSDYLDDEGPWQVACSACGRESLTWAYQREAWRQWKLDNPYTAPDKKTPESPGGK